MLDVDEAIFFGKETRRLASPEREDGECNDILQGQSTSDLSVSIASEGSVAVDVEGDPDDDVRIVNAGENIHQPRRSVKDKLLDGQLDVDAYLVLNGQKANSMILSSLENSFLSCNDSC